jgi:hypothetical protein
VRATGAVDAMPFSLLGSPTLYLPLEMCMLSEWVEKKNWVRTKLAGPNLDSNEGLPQKLQHLLSTAVDAYNIRY